MFDKIEPTSVPMFVVRQNEAEMSRIQSELRTLQEGK